MERLSDLHVSKVEWVQPRTSQQFYELRSGDTVYGSLSFRSAWGTLATAETAGGRWTFKRVGFLNPRVTVRIADQEHEIAIFRPKFSGGGVLTLNDGRSITWKPTNFWASRWTFTDSEGRLLLTFGSGREKKKLADALKVQATVELHDPAVVGELLPILLPLGQYLLILHQQDTAAVVAVTAGASS